MMRRTRRSRPCFLGLRQAMPLARETVTDSVWDLQLATAPLAASRLVKDLVLRGESDHQPSGPAEVRPACDENALLIQSPASRAAQQKDHFLLDRDWAE